MENGNTLFIAFDGQRCLARGTLHDVALAVRARAESAPQSRILVFNAKTGEQIDIDTRGSAEDVLRRLPPQAAEDTAAPATGETGRRGRPKLGVIAREVTLLPRHWEWLGRQPSGASVALRKLVERARRENAALDEVRDAQASCSRFMSAMAGDLPDFEEAARALYARDGDRFDALVAGWPEDLRKHLLDSAAPVFSVSEQELALASRQQSASLSVSGPVRAPSPPSGAAPSGSSWPW